MLPSMEKGWDARRITKSLQSLDINASSEDHKSNCSRIFPSFYCTTLRVQKLKAPSLVNLCLGIVGENFEDIIEDLSDIAANFPSDIKLALAAIARRRKLLNDSIIIDLAESSWEILDLSGSDVSDFGLAKLASLCSRLKAVDISRCSKITPVGVHEILQHCRNLEILRCGGCPQSNYVACASLCLLKPRIEDMDGESWEDLDSTEIGDHGPPISLRWLIWPDIDKDSLEKMWMECPRIVVNPKPSPSFVYNRGEMIPNEAIQCELDEAFVKEIDPKTWSNSGGDHKEEDEEGGGGNSLSIAEKFRLAYVERDNRLAPKRAKNARQRQRRAERVNAETSTMGRALALASRMGGKSSLH